MTMKNVDVRGGRAHERDYTEKAAHWCLKRLGLNTLHTLHLTIRIKPLDDCCGWCKPVGDTNRSFKIVVGNNQTLRNLIMTVVHEMIHVKQYARNEWLIDGEPEAWGSQEILTDELWIGDVL
jgi:hypothetical protein